jgi:hypothetical protein
MVTIASNDVIGRLRAARTAKAMSFFQALVDEKKGILFFGRS